MKNIDFNDILKKLRTSRLPIRISSTQKTIIIELYKMVEKSARENKTTIFTFSPGPLNWYEAISEAWLNEPGSLGCALQLKAFEKNFPALNAVVINVNKHPYENTVGEDGLINNIGLNNLHMLNDEDDMLQKEIGLDQLTLQLDGKNYYQRFSAVIKPNSEAKFFFFDNPVTENMANLHLKEILAFI